MQSSITPFQTRPAISYQRFSRAEQAYGTSEERQGTNTLEYCKKMGFHLLDVFFDRGVSGFKGRHRRKGRLADLIATARQGKMKPGTALIVENLDRLSRETVNIALQQFLELINEHKFEIHTLSDGRIYNSTNLDLGNLVISIVSMGRAHDESSNKSKRIAFSWKSIRNSGIASSKPGKKPMGKHPSWLEWTDGKWNIREDRASVIRYIFEELVINRRLGRYEVARTLIEEKAHYWGRNSGWSAMGVKRYMTNPALIGMLSPDKSTDPDAKPVPNYYPVIINPADYEFAQNLIAARRSTGGRPREHHELAILSGLSFVQGKPLHRGYATQPSGKSQITYAYVDRTSRNRYYGMADKVEQVIVEGILLISASEMEVGSFKISELREKRAALVVERMDFERAVTNYALAIGTDTGEKVIEILKELNRAKTNRDELTSRIDAIDAEIALSGGGTNALDTWNRIKALSASALVDKHPDKRQEVKTLLTRLVKRIDLGRRDQENWWDSFPDWSMPYLSIFSTFSMRDPDEEDDFCDDEDPGTPRKLSQEEKIIAAIEFWNGAKFLLRHRVVWPCHNGANRSS